MKRILRALSKGLENWRESKSGSRKFIEKLFGPANRVGNFDRVRKKGEGDPDEAHLAELNRTWRAMLVEDPWYKRLMTHVSLLLNISGFLFLILFFSGLYLPARHWVPTMVLMVNALTIPYWLWIGGWYAKIERRAFESFRKKFGKHFHLK